MALKRLIDVARVDRSREAIAHAIGDLQGLFETIDLASRATTGPKISSCAMRILGVQSAKTVGSWNQPLATCAAVEPVAAGQQLRAFVFADLHILHHFMSCSSLMQGPMSVAGSRPSPTRRALTRSTNLIEKLACRHFCARPRGWRRCSAGRWCQIRPRRRLRRRGRGWRLPERSGYSCRPSPDGRAADWARRLR